MSNISLSVVFTIHWTAHTVWVWPVSQCYHLPFLYFLTRSFESEDVVHKVSSRRGTVTCPASPNVLYRTASPPGLAPLTALCQPRDVTGWICPLFCRCVKTSQLEIQQDIGSWRLFEKSFWKSCLQSHQHFSSVGHLQRHLVAYFGPARINLT